MIRYLYAELTQLVECHSYKLEVRGPSPLLRTKKLFIIVNATMLCFRKLRMAPIIEDA